MTWIERHLSFLKVVAATAAIAAAAVVLGVSWITGHRSGSISRHVLGLMVLPWVVGFAAFLPVVYHSWFRHAAERRRARGIRHISKLFFWALVAGITVVFVGIYGLVAR